MGLPLQRGDVEGCLVSVEFLICWVSSADLHFVGSCSTLVVGGILRMDAFGGCLCYPMVTRFLLLFFKSCCRSLAFLDVYLELALILSKDCGVEGWLDGVAQG
ncbi:Uncharacterized protein TCM_019896 [Theobroma cacao]|uniref:Uncharacterized protein n=1 Tax=Theobroma cacao TaxID=3641 RepID=A0A061EI98_THECC|nr:Uncharacterized protein TCM_019896 [Theobroma cacao]